ncbi:hypothetical protein FZEAL_4908 [Fusarium zealandicum]|uniref:Autophagy-related protein 29 n=1 Tax=Fusarium zealandicum TaxID=1053134 RepID=A0A8H4ULH2_9HYPO|nr:hypothetical protein FZEAL_4908 [Fusarium zealandicum]
MAEPTYTVFVRVPMPRGDFVDPPPVNWDSNKDEALWKILSGAAKTEIDWTEIADRFEVTVDFLLQQVAYLTERHASQVRAQVRKATAAVRGSTAPSPIPGGDSAGPGHQRAPSALSIRRDSPVPRNEVGSGTGTPLNASIRPVVSRDYSTNTTVLRDMAGGSASPRIGVGMAARTGDQRRRLTSLPISSVPAKSPERAAQPEPEPDERSPSPGPAEDSSATSSEDESSPAQSRIIRRPPRFQQNDGGPSYEDDDDEESEPAFQPYTAPSNKTSAQDLGSTLKGDGRGSGKRPPRNIGKDAIHQSQTSDSSASSAAMVQKPDKSREQRAPGPLSPRRTAELAGRSPGSKSRGYSREGSDGTPSMGSSFSDLEDASVTQSALEEALASHMNHGAGSRFSISQAFRSRYNPSSNHASRIMFRRRWSSLPKDASFPSDLAGLGYFVNNQDEIRSIENPDYYHQFFINKNMRINERQRFNFNAAMEKIIHERLEKEGLVKLPFRGNHTDTEKHCPIFVTPDISKSSRIVIVFGEPVQDLGFLAGRVASGPGGLVQGSMISVVQALAKQTSSLDDSRSPGVVLANMGQRHWWPEEKRALTVAASGDVPLPSLVHLGRRYVQELNEIPGSESPLAHMTSIFESIVASNKDAKIDMIVIGESCEVALNFFENKKNWANWGNRLGGMLFLGTVYSIEKLTNENLKDFLAQRTRGYLISDEALETPLAMPRGNPSLSIEPLGCPCFSAGEPHYIELIAIRALKPALAFLQNVALTPDFVNPDMAVAERCPTDFTNEDWSQLPDDNRPSVTTQDAEETKRQIKEMRRFKEFEETGRAPEWDADSDDDVEEAPRNLGKANWREGEDW